MSKIAKELVIFVSLALPIVLLAICLFFFAIVEGSGRYMFLLFAIIPAILLLLVIWRFGSLKRAGRFVEFSAQLVLDEKALLGAPVILGIFTLVTGFFMLFGGWEITKLFGQATAGSSQQQLSSVGTIVALVFEYFYLIIYFGISYVLNAYVISYATDWYRELDPDLKSARKDVNAVLPIILKYAFVTASITIIFKALSRGIQSESEKARRSGGNISPMLVLEVIGMVIFSIFGAIWAFVNYFTLVSIVQNRKNLSTSIKDSARTMWDSFLDIIVSDVGYGLAMAIFFVVNLLTWFIAGFGIGYFAFPNDRWVAVVLGVLFVVLSFYPYSLITMPMRSSFNTFLYCFAKDSLEGFKKPSRLDPELRENLTLLQSRILLDISKVNLSQFYEDVSFIGISFSNINREKLIILEISYSRSSFLS